MLEVLIALSPALIAGCIIFGLRALLLTAVCVTSAVAAEFVFNLICKKEQSVSDLSAAVTGLILALNLPAETPLWQTAVGAVFAIVAVKCLFGGIGQNFANPAATARVFMILSFTSIARASYPVIVDTAASATPLAVLGGAEGSIPSFFNLVLGVHGGSVGETCSIALIIGGVYLIFRRIIGWRAPLTFICTVFILSFIFSGDIYEAVVHVFSGGLLLGAFFMATDYVTTPTTPSGRAIFGLGCGIITVIIRFWGDTPEGVSFAILIMNIVTPYIDKLTARRTFGTGGASK